VHTRQGYQFYIICFLLLSVCVIVSLPILQAGYFSDDIINSLIPGTLKIYQQGFWHYICEYMQVWMTYGRFFPLSIISTVSIFYLFPDVHHYQIIRLLFIWLSILGFAWLIKLLSKNNWTVMLFLFITPLCWSMRDIPDPLTSFAVFLPLVSFFISTSLITFLYYQRTKKTFWLSLSLLLYTFALASYEVGIVTLFLIIVLSLFEPINKWWQSLKPYLLITLVYIGVYVLLQKMSPAVYDGIQISMNARFFEIGFAQLSSAFPLSYILLASDVPFSSQHILKSAFQQPDQLLLMSYLFFTALIGFYALLNKATLTLKNIICFLSLGLTLLFIPACLIALSQKYQSIVTPGKGYIPVYIQYMGATFILLAGLAWLNVSKWPYQKSLRAGLAFIMSSILVITVIFNLALVQIKNEKYSYKRLLLENALQHGLLSALPTQVTIVEKLNLWNNHDFYAIHTPKNLENVIDINDFKKFTLEKVQRGQIYYLDMQRVPQTPHGFVLIGQIKNFQTKRLTHELQVSRLIEIRNPIIYISAQNEFELNQLIHELQLRLHLQQNALEAIVHTYHLSSQKWLIVKNIKGIYQLPIIY